jgi:ribulose-phosphate 3-epimerase
VDGGVTVGNASALAGAGAEILVAGTAIYGDADPRRSIERLRAAAQEGVRV